MLSQGVIGALTQQTSHFVGRCLLGNMMTSPQAPKMYPCANFGRSTPDSVGGVCGQANRQKEI